MIIDSLCSLKLISIFITNATSFRVGFLTSSPFDSQPLSPFPLLDVDYSIFCTILSLILCLEKTLQFYKQDFTAWEWLLRRLWAITNNPQNNWIDAWLDTIGELLPSEVLTNNNGSTISEEIEKAQNLYTQAGYAMIVINSILDSTYIMVCEWSPNTNAYDPDALYHIDKVEETMKQFEIPLPSSEIVQRLLSEQKSSSFGEPFDGLCFSGISKGK